MLTSFKERVLSRITESLGQRSTYPYSILTGPDIPADVGHFLVQALHRRAILEGNDLVSRQSDWFDFESDQVRSAVSKFLDNLSGTAHFPPDDFDRALRRAVSTCVDYLVQPIETLSTFSVSDRQDENTVHDVRRRAGYFLFYGPFLESVDQYLNRFSGVQLDRNDLKESLLRLETERATSLNADEWLQLLAPLTSAAGIAFGEREGFPSALAVAFIQEKGMENLADAIRSEGERSEGFITTDSLRATMQQILDPPVLSAPPPTRSGTVGDSLSDADQADLPLWKQFSNKDQPTTSEAFASSPAGESPQPLWKTYRTDEPTDADAPTDVDAPTDADASIDAETSSDSEKAKPGIDLPDRDRYVRDLFRGNEVHYTETLDRLAHAGDWESASSILSSDVFRRYNVDIYGDAAVSFTNAIEERVRQLS